MKYKTIPLRYLPKRLSRRDKIKQRNMLLKSRKLYTKKIYFTRKNVPSYKSKKSSHITSARKIYKVDKIGATHELAKVTGCSLASLKEIVKKGEGAYFSSGSRPNQTAQSWAIARLASSVTGGKAAMIDYSILKKGCNHKKKAFILANKAKRKYTRRRIPKA